MCDIPTEADPEGPDDGAKDTRTNDGFSTGEPDRICPISGWEVQRRPEWTGITFEPGFTITAEIIGGSVLITHNHGRASVEGVHKAFDFTEAIIAEHLAGHPYIHILDYANLEGTSLEGRRFFIRRMLQRRHLVGVIFYGLSPLLRMSTKLGKRLNMVPFNVHIADGYEDAVTMSMALLKAARAKDGSATGLSTSHLAEHYRSPDGVSYTILRRDDWAFDMEGFRVRFEVIDGHILHSISEGHFKDIHLSPLISLRDRISRSLASVAGPNTIIGGFKGLHGVDRRARKYYLDAITAWHRKAPLKRYIVYGLDPFMEAVVNFSRFALPFPVAVAKDLDSALILAREKDQDPPGQRHRVQPSEQDALSSGAVEHLLEFIGSIDWERDGVSNPSQQDTVSSPLSPIYDAIKVIKSEMDDLLNEKDKAEKAVKKARDELDSRVRERTAELIAINRRLQTEITERREVEVALRSSEKNYRDLVESVNSIILRWDAEGRIVFMNPYGLKFFGYDAQDLIGQNVMDTIVPERESISKRNLTDLMIDIQKDPDRFRKNENENITREGKRVWIYWTNRAITDTDGRIVEILSVGNDITGRRHMEAELRRLATTDPLTGAFNRRRFFQKARQEFLRHHRYGHPFSVLLMDMDHFKKINDSHGHPVGDAVLKAFVETCQSVFRVTDVFGRTGGEEFSAVLPETDAAKAVLVAERLRDRVMNRHVEARPGKDPIRFTVSIGLTGLHEEDVALETMIRRADNALYTAKRTGRNRVVQE